MKIKGLTEKINQTLSDKDNTINYLEEEQQKYQGLAKEVNQFLTKYKVQNFTQLSNGIQGLLSDRQNFKDERDQAQIEITNKDNRIAQLEKLFKGTAQIFSKQHNYVDQLKERLEQEKQNQGLSQEQIDHLQADIKRLDEEKKELTERIEELRIKEEFLKEFRDKELADLRQQKTELEDKHKEFIEEIKNRMGEEGNVIMRVGMTKEEEIFEKIDHVVGNLRKWKQTFPNQTPKQIQKRLLNDKEKKALQQICAALTVGNSGNINSAISLNNAINNFGSIDCFEVTNPDLPKGERGVNVHFGKMTNHLKNLLLEYQKEKYWWDKWANDDPFEADKYGDFENCFAREFRYKLFFVSSSDRARGIQFITDRDRGVNWTSIYREFKRVIKEIICEYYKRKFD